MRNANANDECDQKNRSHIICTGALPYSCECECQLCIHATKCIAASSDRSKGEWFIGRENNSHQSRQRVVHAERRYNLQRSLLICFHHLHSHSHSHYRKGEILALQMFCRTQYTEGDSTVRKLEKSIIKK